MYSRPPLRTTPTARVLSRPPEKCSALRVRELCVKGGVTAKLYGLPSFLWERQPLFSADKSEGHNVRILRSYVCACPTGAFLDVAGGTDSASVYLLNFCIQFK